MDRKVKRRYDSAGRRAAADATRDRICAAAERLFLRDGYGRTSMGAVARQAKVAPATVYNAFSTKAALLDAVILRAVRDNEGEPLIALLEGSPRRIVPRIAATHAATLGRAAQLIALGEGAALMDAALRPMRDRAHARLRTAYGALAQALADAGLLRAELTPAEAAETMFSICNETTYMRFTGHDTAANDRYATWLAGVLEATLLRPPCV
jgi:TetR/AcrR family transcriptional regulator, regulator of autoinduction and epiphytic fitness